MPARHRRLTTAQRAILTSTRPQVNRIPVHQLTGASIMNINTLIDTNPGLYMAHAYAAQFFDQCSCLLDARTPLKMTNAQFNECIENLKTACEASGVEVKD